MAVSDGRPLPRTGEVFNSTTYTKQRSPSQPFPQWKPAGPLGTLCQPLAELSVVADTYLLGPSSSGVLRPSFTWHGFQHIIVSVSDSVDFTPSPSSIRAEWTTTDAEATGAIAFGGGKDADMLNSIRGIAQAGQLSNMAAFVPTDCPTREKHAWLGDGMDVAEEALYNFWAVPMCGCLSSRYFTCPLPSAGFRPKPTELCRKLFPILLLEWLPLNC